MEFLGLSVDFPHKLQQKWSNWWWFKLFVFVSLFCGSDSSAKKAPRRLQRGPGFCTRCMRCFCCFWTFVEGFVLGSLKNGDRRMGELFCGSMLDWIQPLPRMLAPRTEGFTVVWDLRKKKRHKMSSSWWLLLGGWAERMEMCCSPVLFQSSWWSFLEFLTPQALRNKSQACCSYQ